MLFPLFAIAALLLGGLLVMLLWNAILPIVTSVKPVTYWQAVGLLILSKILFSGWKGKPGGHPGHRPDFRKHMEWREKWKNMSMGERMQFKQEWRERCKKKGGHDDGERGDAAQGDWENK
ncbi:MAG: hypothetical protein IPJ74_04240 [Saprospiraceae bacterium]|nr:hypothetical protein [Saprospiraceae bacterium]